MVMRVFPQTVRPFLLLRGGVVSFAEGERMPVTVKRGAGASLPSQIAEQVRALIVAGSLVAGDPVPSSRALAGQLNVSRGTVVFAYEQLMGEGYLSTGRGGTRVAPGLVFERTAIPTGGEARPAIPANDGAPRIDLSPGAPDTSLLASDSWRAAWRRAAASPGAVYGADGSASLRAELAEHLRLTRSVVRTPEDILVTAGARDGFRLLLTALRQRVRNRPLRIAVENPGYPSLHRIPLAFNHEVLPIEVDKDGLNPALLPVGARRPDIVLVAPSHQYPLGASMPASRRLELLDWARTHDAFIVEDDYDSELRYTGDPLPALAALDRPAGAGVNSAGDRVVTLGSFARLLAPGLNLGFIVMPQQLRAELLVLRADLGNPVSALVQDAVTDFLAVGGVRRHTARMRRVYRARRQLVVDTLADVPGVEVLPMDGGLHAVVRLHSDSPATEGALVAALAAVGVKVAPLSAYWSAAVGPGAVSACGLVLGFGGAGERQLVEGLGLLRTVLRNTLGGAPAAP